MKIKTDDILEIDFERANRKFTDRTEPRKAFWDEFELVKNELSSESQVHVLSYYGIGGIGKTSLLHELQKETNEKAPDTKYIHFDFDKATDPLTVIRNMRNLLLAKYKFSFPLFDVADYLYAQKTGNERELKKDSFINRSAVLKLIFSVVGTIPVANLYTTILNIADESFADLRTYYIKHSKSLKHMDTFDAQQILEYMPIYFAKDMEKNISKSKEPFVFFLDTYEMLVNELIPSGEPLTRDEWLRSERGIIQSLPNTLWVIAGREKLKWETFDPDWSEALNQHLLGSLSASDSDDFLQSCSVEPKQLRDSLFKLTDGTPVYLDICVNQYMLLNEPTIEDFGKTPTELIERFGRYLTDSQRDIVYLCSFLQVWDNSVFYELAPKILTGFSLTTYEKAKNLSFISTTDSINYTIHKTVGNVLWQSCNTDMKKHIAKGIMGYFEKAIEALSADNSEFYNALTYMLRAADELYQNTDEYADFFQLKIISHWKNMADCFLLSNAHTILDHILLRAGDDKTCKLYVTALENKAYLSLLSGNYILAKTLAYEALTACEKSSNYSPDDAVSSKNILAMALCRLSSKQDLIQAKEYFTQIYNHLKNKSNTTDSNLINVMSNLALVYDSLSEFENSRGIYEQALKLSEDSQSDACDILTIKENLAMTLSHIGKKAELDMAEHMLGEVLNQREKLYTKSHPLVFHVMGNLSEVCAANGKYDKSLKYAQLVLDKTKELYGNNHPETINAMNCLAVTLRSLKTENALSQALELQKDVIKFSKETLGENEVPTLEKISSYCVSLMETGKKEDIELSSTLLYENAQKLEELIGIEAAKTLNCYDFLAVAYNRLGEHDKALKIHKKILPYYDQVFGRSSYDTFVFLNNVSTTFYLLEKYSDAEKILRKAIANVSHGLDTTIQKENLAACLVNIGTSKKLIEAEKLLRELIALHKTKKPYNKQALKSNLKFLAKCLVGLGRQKEAFEIFSQIEML